MSELLNDSPTAVKFRDRVLSELHTNEQVLFATDAQVTDPEVRFLWAGSVIVTHERLLVVEQKMMGRVAFHSLPWTEVEKTGWTKDGAYAIQRVSTSNITWSLLWKIEIWEGKSHKTPLDKKRLELLSRFAQEARDAVAGAQAADVDSEYEEIRRRRES